MSIPSYPAELEAHWIRVAQAETRGTALRDALHRLLPDVRRLADRFTVARPADADAAPYLRDTRACAAYSLYFAPQTHARLAAILAELPPFPKPRGRCASSSSAPAPAPPPGRCSTSSAGGPSR